MPDTWHRPDPQDPVYGLVDFWLRHKLSSHDKAASSDEATSSGEVPVPPNTDTHLVAEEPNRWYVEGQWQIYMDASMLNEKRKKAQLITEKRRVLTERLHTIPNIHQLSQKHKCEWMDRIPGNYSAEIVREFYASYAATLCGSIDKRVLPTKADNALTWDRAVMVPSLVAGFEIDFAHMLLAVIHKRAFRTTTTLPFPCMIFQLCSISRLHIWHCDPLVQVTGTFHIDLIRDEANVAAPRRGPQIKVP
uniref:Integrase core domain containing protein n=1 Tax=Solanum tuberosum TaxID=4113 RepID=M1D955_SOLTU